MQLRHHRCLILSELLISELVTKGVGSKIGAKWIAEKKVLPLFDGLDEVRSDLQPACVSAINQFLSGEDQPLSIVVCSRYEEYELYLEKLHLNGAIYLQELSNEQIESYLEKVDRLELWQVLAIDSALLDLVRQPLLLHITLVAYREEVASQWKELRLTQERLAFLLSVYVERMLHWQIKSNEYIGKTELSSQQTYHFLQFLAKQLERESITEFLIERIQPSWLMDSKHVLMYQVCVGTWTGTIISSYFIVSFLKLSGSIFSTSLSIILGILMGLLFSRQEQLFTTIETVETIQVSWSVASNQFIQILKFGLILILLFLAVCFALARFGLLNHNLPSEILQKSPEFLVSLLLSGLVFGTLRGLWGGREVENKLRANEGIWRSACMAISCLVALGAIKMSLTFSQRTDIYSFLLFLLALRLGGYACLQHFSLRLVLFLSGSIPWNYARFLNYATERMFLQRIGGRYRFIHKLLQDHFAATSNEN